MHNVHMIVEIRTSAHVPGRQPDLVAQRDVILRLIVELQAAMLSA